MSIYEETLEVGGPYEGNFMLIKSIVTKNPESINIFVDRFNQPKENDDKEILAQIIITHLHYQPAIEYLKSIGEDDFTGYAGFSEKLSFNF